MFRPRIAFLALLAVLMFAEQSFAQQTPLQRIADGEVPQNQRERMFETVETETVIARRTGLPADKTLQRLQVFMVKAADNLPASLKPKKIEILRNESEVRTAIVRATPGISEDNIRIHLSVVEGYTVFLLPGVRDKIFIRADTEGSRQALLHIGTSSEKKAVEAFTAFFVALLEAPPAQGGTLASKTP